MKWSIEYTSQYALVRYVFHKVAIRKGPVYLRLGFNSLIHRSTAYNTTTGPAMGHQY